MNAADLFQLLVWESAGTDEPGDQNADSSIVPDGCTSSYYSLGPEAEGRWSLELIAVSNGDEISGAGVEFGSFASEVDAKAAAERHEESQTCGGEPDDGKVLIAGVLYDEDGQEAEPVAG